MSIRRKTTREILDDMTEIKKYVSTQWIQTPGLSKNEQLAKRTTEELRHLLMPRTEEHRKDRLIALKKVKIFNTIENNKKPDELLLYVSQKSIFGRHLSYCIYDVTDDNDTLPLESFANPKFNIPSNIATIHVLLETKDSIKTLEMPEEVKRRLLDYMRSMRTGDPEEDCSYFASYMLGIHDLIKKKGSKYGTTNWKQLAQKFIFSEERFSPEILKPGDEVTLVREKSPKHYGIYLGEGMYVSKFGQNGLAMCTLEQMHKHYNTDRATIDRRFFALNDYDQCSNIKEDVRKMADHLKADLAEI